MDVLVVGAGAVGTFYGAKLAQSGARVSLLCRSDYEHVREHGVCIRSVWGDFDFQPESVVRNCAEFAESGRRADVLLVALKVLPDIGVVGMIRPAVVPGQTSILLLQNGIDIEPPVAAAFPENRVVSGLAFTCINRTGPGVRRQAEGGELTVGDSGPPSVWSVWSVPRNGPRLSPKERLPCNLCPRNSKSRSDNSLTVPSP